jgi:integrase
VDWGYWPEDRRTPIAKVDIGRKWVVRPQRILTPAETERVLARLDDPNLLVCETCMDTGTRISEVTGLKLKHVDLDRGCIHIEQRNWRGEIDDPKTAGSKRTLALGKLVGRYEAWMRQRGTTDPEAWVFPRRGDNTAPLWDSGVRQALKGAAEDENRDFPGFGPHSRREVGASAIEASRIAGHSKINMTGEYTIVQLKRQDELTRKIQDLRGAGASDQATEVGADKLAAESAA